MIKKLERERHGWSGSRATKEQLAEELADVVHTAFLCAITAGIHLEPAVIDKFNSTSEKNGLASRIRSCLLDKPEAVEAALIADLSALVRMLVRKCEKAGVDLEYMAKARDFLKRKGLQGSALREYLDKPEAVEGVAVPEGWQLVPKAPTEDMMRKGRWGGITPLDEQRRVNMAGIWKAMLAAAPMAPADTDAAQSGGDGPFHVSRSSDGERNWFSARDAASGVTIPLDTKERASALVTSLNRAFAHHLRMAALSAAPEPVTVEDGVREAGLFPNSPDLVAGQTPRQVADPSTGSYAGSAAPATEVHIRAIETSGRCE
ncbi:hypothetical protein CN203_24000 [Sinorhizobium meliloti]|uniref:hypothetical protein n=1 Tax=Rhizobium meliloti TaxID=382 RepID=UPI000FD79DAE|nr:hypothetical protein [Sinorhizobium meliloti]RVH74172.1 hypothetical protein CN203_24000 [Sinorhizobium meliloti]